MCGASAGHCKFEQTGVELHLATKRGHGRLEKVIRVLLGELDPVGDRVKVLNGDCAGTVKAVRDANGVNAAIEQSLTLF